MPHQLKPRVLLLIAAVILQVVGPLHARTVLVRADPTIDVATLLPAAQSAVAGMPDVNVVAGETFDIRRPDASPPEARFVAFVSTVSLDRRSAVRVVVVDVARGLRLDVDATSVTTSEATVPDVVAASIARALAKAAEPVEFVCVAAPVAYPEVKPTVDLYGQPVPFLPEPMADDAILSALLAAPGVAVAELEYRTAACPVLAIDATPLLPAAAPRWIFEAKVDRAEGTVDTALTPGTITLNARAPDGGTTKASVPIARVSDLGRSAAAATREVSRHFAAGKDRGGPATRPVAARITELIDSAERPDDAIALAEFAIAEAPDDLASRRQAATCYTIAVTARPVGETFRHEANVPPERAAAIVDFERRVAFHDRGLAHVQASLASQANASATSPTTDGVDPLVALSDAEPLPWTFGGNAQELLAEKRAARQRAMHARFSAWAAESIAAGRLNDGVYAAQAIDRLPEEEQIEATRQYIAKHLETPGLIERLIAISSGQSGSQSVNGKVIGSRSAALSLLQNTTSPARWRQASQAVTRRLVERPRVPFRPQGWPGSLRPPGRTQIRTLPITQPAPGQAAEIEWSPMTGFPFEMCPVLGDGRRFGWRANQIAEFDENGNPTVLYDATGPNGEVGHVFDIAYDGRFLYAAIFRPWMPDAAPPLFVLDTQGGEPTFLGTEAGLPSVDADRLSLAAIAPGRLFVVGTSDTTWYGTLAYNAGRLAFDRFAETRPLPPSASLHDPLVRQDPRSIRRVTTAEADDAAQPFTSAGVRLAGRDDSGLPTHAFVFRDSAAQRRPLIVSLADRSVRTFADAATRQTVFAYGDELYLLRPAVRSDADRAPAPVTTRPTTANASGPMSRPVRRLSIARLDRDAGQLETTMEGALSAYMFVPMTGSPIAANGRIYALSDFCLVVSDGPDRPFRPLLPGFDPGTGMGPFYLESASDRSITVWTGTKKMRGTLRTPASSQPTQ